MTSVPTLTEVFSLLIEHSIDKSPRALLFAFKWRKKILQVHEKKYFVSKLKSTRKLLRANLVPFIVIRIPILILMIVLGVLSGQQSNCAARNTLLMAIALGCYDLGVLGYWAL